MTRDNIESSFLGQSFQYLILIKSLIKRLQTHCEGIRLPEANDTERENCDTDLNPVTRNERKRTAGFT